MADAARREQPARWRRRKLSSPTPPPDPLRSPELRLVMADIEEALTGQAGLYDTVLEGELARLAGRTGAAERYLPADADPEVRSAFGGEKAIELLLGDWQDDGTFLPGLAGLTDQECRAYELRLNGFEPVAIARFMDRKRASRFGDTSLSVEAVDKHLGNARRKLFRLFGVGDTPVV